MVYAGLFFGLGGLLFGALTSALPLRARQICLDLMTAAAVALPVSVGLHGLERLGRPLSDALFPEVWRAGFFSAYGSAVLAALAALALGLLALGLRRWRGPLALGALASAAGFFALSLPTGEAASQIGTRLFGFLHAAGLMVWLGALAPLGFSLVRRTPRALAALERFASWSPYAAALALLSGGALTAARLGWPGASWPTSSGLLSLGWLALLGALFAATLWSLRRLTGPALEGSPRARLRLRDSLGLQAALALGALSLVAGARLPEAAPTSAPTDLAALSAPSGGMEISRP